MVLIEANTDFGDATLSGISMVSVTTKRGQSLAPRRAAFSRVAGAPREPCSTNQP